MDQNFNATRTDNTTRITSLVAFNTVNGVTNVEQLSAICML